MSAMTYRINSKDSIRITQHVFIVKRLDCKHIMQGYYTTCKNTIIMYSIHYILFPIHHSGIPLQKAVVMKMQKEKSCFPISLDKNDSRTPHTHLYEIRRSPGLAL